MYIYIYILYMYIIIYIYIIYVYYYIYITTLFLHLINHKLNLRNPATLLKRDSNTGVFHECCQIFKNIYFRRTSANGYFCIY